QERDLFADERPGVALLGDLLVLLDRAAPLERDLDLLVGQPDAVLAHDDFRIEEIQFVVDLHAAVSRTRRPALPQPKCSAQRHRGPLRMMGRQKKTLYPSTCSSPCRSTVRRVASAVGVHTRLRRSAV